MKRFVSAIRVGLGAILMAGAVGCASVGGVVSQPLRVGVTTDYAPIIYKDGGKIVGIEAEFARHFAKETGRALEFVDLRWEEQVPALLRGDIDVIMSGLSVTSARKVRVAFSSPYLDTGLVAMFRRQDAERFHSPVALMQSISNVGFKRGTTAERYVQENFPNASRRGYMLPKDAALDLQRRRLDVFIHDGPAVAWLVSSNESELTALFTLLTDDKLAWAVRPDDTELLAELNRALAGWRENGILQALIDRWLPYRRKFTE